ncbi:hypothetical protein RHSIM_Rhsim07G0227400 [Rhododendron simsii]|uniref:OTU domain-containing protein n=1 Tax=Rhododendron simsii TaxID=118357 RepID=A0A834GLE8_RHOSS|nr:hypothetical protein RHSIM_Rhsim07G0227400 [Rhododendron simsii]
MDGATVAGLYLGIVTERFIRFGYKSIIVESDCMDMMRAIKSSGEDIPDDFFDEFMVEKNLEVASAKVIRDRQSELSVGYGFVEFFSHDAANEILLWRREGNKNFESEGNEGSLLWGNTNQVIICEANHGGIGYFTLICDATTTTCSLELHRADKERCKKDAIKKMDAQATREFLAELNKSKCVAYCFKLHQSGQGLLRRGLIVILKGMLALMNKILALGPAMMMLVTPLSISLPPCLENAVLSNWHAALLRDRGCRFEIDIRLSKGLEVKRMMEDGNCLFRAVADQLYGYSEGFDLVRQMCMLLWMFTLEHRSAIFLGYIFISITKIFIAFSASGNEGMCHKGLIADRSCNYLHSAITTLYSVRLNVITRAVHRMCSVGFGFGPDETKIRVFSCSGPIAKMVVGLVGSDLSVFSCALRHQQFVAPPQPLVILRQRCGLGGGVAADAVVGCEGRRVGPLVGGIRRRGAELGWVIIESGAEGGGGMGVLVVVVRGYLRGARGFPPVDLAEQLFFQ